MYNTFIILITAQKKGVWPQSLQSTMWTLQKIRQQLHVWSLQVVVTQIQFSQTGGVWLQSWSQRRTAFLCDLTAWQPANTQTNITKLFNNNTICCEEKSVSKIYLFTIILTVIWFKINKGMVLYMGYFNDEHWLYSIDIIFIKYSIYSILNNTLCSLHVPLFSCFVSF